MVTDAKPHGRRRRKPYPSRISLGATPHTDNDGDGDGEFATTANATVRFLATHTDLPYVEATHSGGTPVVRVSIYGPDPARLNLTTQDAALDARPADSSSWR